MNSNAEQTQEPPASEPRSVPPDGAGRRRSCRKAVVFFALCALLLAGGFAWHVRRAEARRSELVRLVSGPLLPGTADVEYTWHLYSGTFVPRPREFFQVSALPRRDLGADLVRRRISRFEDGDGRGEHWIVAAGSSAENRLFDFLRADPFVEKARTDPRPFRGGNYVSWHELEAVFPTNASDRVNGPSETETFAFRDRLTGFFEAESVRPDVAFREERQTFFLSCVCVPRHMPGWFRRAVGRVCGKLDAAPLAPLSEWAERGPGGTDDPLFRISWTTIEIWDGVPAPGFRLGKNASGFPRTFVVPDGTPLAAAIRNLCAKRRPWTFGTPFSRANPLPPDREFSATLTGWNGEEEWAVSSEVPTPRFRAFVTDLLRLLADPPSDTPSPAAEETHAESAETAESGSPAGGAGERSETEGVSHAENAETAEPRPGERSEPEGVSRAKVAEFSACAAAGDVVVSFATPNGVQPNGVQPAGATNEEQRSRNPGYTQELCEALWQTSSEGDTLRPADIARALEAVFDREREHYVFYVKQLTALQFRVLRALAQHGGREIYSAHFLEAANTVNRTSVKKAVAKIEKADLVYRHESEYRFVNPFFREWIKRGF